MKMIVETTRSIMLMGPSRAENVESDRPYVVLATNFIHGHVANGDIRILRDELLDSATDAEWEAHLADCMTPPANSKAKFDEKKAKALAIESFVDLHTEQPAEEDDAKKSAKSTTKKSEE